MWNGDERRTNSKSLVREQIFKAIQDSEDKNLKAILALMYGSLEYTDDAIIRIEAKLDALRHDEATLKKLVLNGYNEKHHTHHEWLDRRIGNDQAIINFIERTTPIVDWVEEYQKEVAELRPVCDWAKASKQAAEIAHNDKKTLIMKFLGGALNQIGTVVATALVAWIMWGPK